MAEYRNRRDSAVTLRLDPAEIRALYGFLALGSHFAALLSGESSQFSPGEVRNYTAAISTKAGSTLTNKICVAAATIQNRTGNRPTMKILEDLVQASESGEHYREVAGKLRLLAQQIRYPHARREILSLAIRYEQRGDHFDRRARDAMSDPPHSG